MTPHDKLSQDFDNFRTFYGTDKLRALDQNLEDLKKTTSRSATVQLIATALTPIITLGIALSAYSATKTTEAEKNRTERIKLVADLYSKALTQDSAYILYNTANLTTALLRSNSEDDELSRTVAANLNTLANHKAAIKPIPVMRNSPVDSGQLSQQKSLFGQLSRNADLTTQATGAAAAKAAINATHVLAGAGKQADALANTAYNHLLKGRIDSAQKYFALADFAYPSRYNYFELSHYLGTYANKLPAAGQSSRQLTSEQQQAVANQIVTKYSYGVPGAIKTRLAAQAEGQ